MRGDCDWKCTLVCKAEQIHGKTEFDTIKKAKHLCFFLAILQRTTQVQHEVHTILL